MPDLVRLQSYKGTTNYVDISNSGEHVIGRSSREEIAVWKRTGMDFALVSRLKTEDRIWDLHIREKEILLASLLRNGRICISKLTAKGIVQDQALTHEEGLEGIIPTRSSTLAISPDCRSLIYLSRKDTAIELWNLPLKRNQKPVRLLDKRGIALVTSFSSDATQLAVVNDDSVARIWDLRKGTLLARINLPEEAGPFFQARFSRDKKSLALAYGMSWGWELELMIYDFESKKAARMKFPAHRQACDMIPGDERVRTIITPKVKDATFTPDLRQAYSCDNAGNVYAYQITSKTRKLIHRAKDTFQAIALSPRSDFIALGGWYGTIDIIWLQQRLAEITRVEELVEKAKQNPKDPRPIKELVRCAEGKQEWARIHTFAEMAKLGAQFKANPQLKSVFEEHLVPAISKGLEDSSGLVRGEAALTAAGFGPVAQPLVPNLIQAMKKYPVLEETALFSVQALGEIGPGAQEALPIIEKTAKRWPDYVDKEIINRALKRIRGK
jgi:hypothetical protein